MKPLPKQYDPKEAEPRLQAQWEKDRVHAWRDDKPRSETYVIDTPPPTVSGVLHMGHIFSYTQADFIARFMRMSGKDVFYPMGFDDNGLPTERLVEKQIKKRAVDMPREEFIRHCQEVTKEYEDQFRDMFKSVALSVDWSQEYQTISADSRRISQMSFLDLYKKGEVYRDFRPTYWDWVDQTAIAQAEIEDKELPTTENIIVFKIIDENATFPLPENGGSWDAEVMTTRPELLGACVALMCHPDDEAKYKGKKAVTPLFGVIVPIIADPKVNKEKGTGLVMCCTFGDDTDKEWWRKYKLPMRAILRKDGRLNFYLINTKAPMTEIQQSLVDYTEERIDALPDVSNYLIEFIENRSDNGSEISSKNSEDFKKCLKSILKIDGLKPKQANAKIIELLQANGTLRKQTNITHSVKCAERSGTPIEIIPTQQWYVKIMDKKDALLAKGAECNWHPEFMKIRLDQWIEGLKEDWCISRQRYSGVPFPAWFSKRAGEEGKIIVADVAQLPVDPLTDLPEGYSHEEVDADKDILDTWATSSVSPQLSSRGINRYSSFCGSTAESSIKNLDAAVKPQHDGALVLDAERHAKLFPADLRPQAHEIIRTWAFYTIVKACLHENTIPWSNLMISGWCLAADKTKMSKSKGNVVTPVELIRDKGADAVRYWASTSRLGADTAFSEDLLKIGRKLVTKLWNAANFTLTILEKNSDILLGESEARGSNPVISETLDRWIISRLRKTIIRATEAFESYEYADARVAVEEFFWKDFCDNYLELVKARAYGEGGTAEGLQSAVFALHHCLDVVLRLFAPFVPHVTEEIYSHLFDEFDNSIHSRGNWPEASDYFVDESAEQAGISAMSVLEAVRKAKSEKNVSIKFPITRLEISADDQTKLRVLEPVLADLKSAGNINEIAFTATLPAAITTADGYQLGITFAEQAEVA